MERESRWRCCRHLTVEPSFLLVAYSLALFEAPFQDLLLQRICQQTSEVPFEWCEALPEHPTAEAVIHPRAATLLMVGGLMETVLPAMTSCLAGAWSDRAGSRKPLIVIPLTGYILKFALLAAIMSVPWVPVECFLIGYVPVAISGGFTTLFGAVTSVVADEAPTDQKTFRLGMLQVVFIVGLLPGGLTSSATLRALGHTGVFLLAGGACFLALVIALTNISETYIAEDRNEGTFFAVYVMSRKMKMGDATLALVSYSGACAGSLVRAFASDTGMMYAGSVISLLHGAASPMMRSIMSKSVPQNELGKIFTLTASLEALVPLAAQPLYTYLFNNTLQSFPGAFFILSALMFFIDTILSGIIYVVQGWYSPPERQPLLPREDSAHEVPNT
ncbi:proton-coupled folate transporter-like isoform X2 [Ischnura elegans]|uniref:proton-coupled folate transporter-like isoform X2 n=1 Tax=Ischnura elegans TaxID=197161 RepID=UPI001ED8BC71|nr:proton-coupled folate transporter-like isoform X2 [Ischnura elegans]